MNSGGFVPSPRAWCNLVLTGFMGTGKTSVGREIAQRLGRKFVDMDSLIETREGRAVPDIFRDQGELYFRRLEAALCRELAALPDTRSGPGADSRQSTDVPLVIATGGGALIPQDNLEILSASGSVVCLTASPDEIRRRLESAGDRPLLEVADRRSRIETLLDERSEAYRRIPLQVDTTDLTVGQAADRVLALASGPALRRIQVPHPGGEYPIHLGRGLLADAGSLFREQGLGSQVALVTNPNVGDLYHGVVAESLEQCGYRAATCTVPDGESHKSLGTVRTMYDAFIDAGLDRSSTVVALGGGVIGDMAGFAAATYLRGVDLVQVPTTLLSMVDSSVGGKVAVDHPRGKNLIGAFKQPALVLADTDTLSTLPHREFASGLGETVKTALIGDPLLFEQIESHGPAPIVWVIERALRVKVSVVEADPYEAGRRAVLNLGHTFGHALELLSGYTLSHGEAVAVGLAAAARLSARMGLCDPSLPERVEEMLARLGLPITIQRFTPDQIWRAMGTDKKRRGNKLRFILLRDVGDVFVTDDVSHKDALSVLETMRES